MRSGKEKKRYVTVEVRGSVRARKSVFLTLIGNALREHGFEVTGGDTLSPAMLAMTLERMKQNGEDFEVEVRCWTPPPM